MKGMLLKDQGLKDIDRLAECVYNEGKSQIAKWGVQTCSPEEWMLFLTEEVGELAEAIAEEKYRDGNYSAVFSEAIQCATLSLKIAEMYSLLASFGPKTPFSPTGKEEERKV